MTTISRSVFQNETIIKQKDKSTLFTKYKVYAERQSEFRVLWFLLVILFIPCVLMVLSIFAMAMMTANFIWFVALSMLLFFTNVVTYIGHGKSTFYVPLFHATTALFILIPLITYLIQL